MSKSKHILASLMFWTVLCSNLRPDLNWKKSAQGMMLPEVPVFHLSVEAPNESVNVDPPTRLHVTYPNYLQDLQSVIPNEQWTMRHSCQYLFNNEVLKYFNLGDVLEIRIREHQHPLHVHINPMQVMMADHHIGNFMPGDWFDTFHGKGRVRLKMTDFEGPRIFHCHWFAHSDLGCMGILQVGDQNLTNDLIYLNAKEEVRIKYASPNRNYSLKREPLTSPMEISYKDFADFNVETHFYLDTLEYRGPYTRFWTRTINGGIPGPTIRVKRGQNLTLHYHNLLEGQDLPHQRNQFGVPNTTNLHFHGLHVKPGDPTKTRINPGKMLTYHVQIPADHLPGTHWYHPHYHGSSALQATGGAHGLIIVDDDVGTLPDWLENAEEKILVLSSIPQTVNSLQWLEFQSRGNLSVKDAGFEFLLVNGQVEPVIKMQAGKWYRWRMLLVSLNRHLKLTIPSACDSYLLATDGIYVQNSPRKSHLIPFASGNRVDVAVRCSKAGDYEIRTYAGLPVWKSFAAMGVAVVAVCILIWFAAPSVVVTHSGHERPHALPPHDSLNEENQKVAELTSVNVESSDIEDDENQELLDKAAINSDANSGNVD